MTTRLVLIHFVFAVLLAGCAAPVRQLSELELQSAYARFTEAYNEELTKAERKSRRRIFREYTQSPDTQSYDVLVLSGGGPLGAFGAGFLKGWGSIGSGEFERPEFDSVSGISTGALIAPFAFVGDEQAYDAIVDLYANPDEDFIVAKALVGLLTGNSSYYDATQLHARIRNSMSERIIDKVSEGGVADKILFAGATNLDFGQMRVWDLSNLEGLSTTAEKQRYISQRLIASSAIPGAFPPVEIDNLLYVDGGASMQVVGGIDDREWLYKSQPEDVDFVQSERPIRIRIWVIVNKKLIMEPEVTSPTWSSIATRSLITLMRGSTLQSLQGMETFAELMNQQPLFDVKMRYVAIPQSYNIPDTRNLFDKDKMRGLVELGEEMGADPQSWKRRALRPGAPFENK